MNRPMRKRIRYGMNIHGERVERTPREYPYSYDPFQVFKDPAWTDRDAVVYSDRMYQWDWEKYDRCCEKVWNDRRQSFSGRDPAEIERFLQLYFEDPTLMLTGIEAGCNYSNGYPFWVFYMKGEKVCSSII